MDIETNHTNNYPYISGRIPYYHTYALRTCRVIPLRNIPVYMIYFEGTIVRSK